MLLPLACLKRYFLKVLQRLNEFIRVQSMVSSWSGQNEDICPSIKKSMQQYIYKFSLHEFGMLLSPIIAEELAQPYCPSKCRPLQLEWKTGIPKFHLEIMAFNLHNVSWWVYCLYTYSLFVLSFFIFFIYSLSILNLSFYSL